MKYWLLAVICAGVTGSGVPVHATAPVRLRVNSYVMQAPANLYVIAVVPRDADNRSLRLTADSGGYYTSTEFQLDGAAAATDQTVWFKDLPAGDYSVTAQLFGPKGVRGRAAVEVNIVGIP